MHQFVQRQNGILLAGFFNLDRKKVLDLFP